MGNLAADDDASTRNWGSIVLGIDNRFIAPGRRARMLIATLAATALTLGLFAAVAPPAAAESTPAETVGADPLPTAQIDGVAWTQAIAGGIVWVGGEFTTARPAGAAPGEQTVPRANLMAYDLETGELLDWNPGANGTVRTITASPDGSRIYVGGTFTTTGGKTRYRLAAYDTATGALLSWAPYSNAGVIDIATHGETVFIGGNFTILSTGSRARIGAVSATNGALLPLTATLSGGYGVQALVVDPTGTKLVVGGSFTSTNGQSDPGRGMAALDALTGASLPWAVNSLIHNSGTGAAITDLASDGESVYGTAYDYGGAQENKFEGTFRARWSDGQLVWLEDCHGDNYAVAVSSGTVYISGHDHYCGNIGGFPQTETLTFRHALAFSAEYLGNTLTRDIYGYRSFAGMPAASLLHWFPVWQVGTYTGKSQATWAVTADEDYVVYGGEFLRVNGIAQQGLVRFAKKSVTPSTSGPERSGADFAVTATSATAGEVRLAWTANTDADDATLTYEVLRSDRGDTPVCTQQASSNFWTMPALVCVDDTAVPGSTVQYRVRAVDPDGNAALGAPTTVTVAAESDGPAYDRSVLADGAVHYWPLEDEGGVTAEDVAGQGTLTLTGATPGVAGPNPDTLAGATSFPGTKGSYGTTTSVESGMQQLTLEAWFQTTSTSGGKVVAFGNRSTTESTMHDRAIYLDGTGRVTFGVTSSGYKTLTSAAGLNDGEWHHVVATLSGAGITLSVDGVQIGARSDARSAQNYSGYWRIGGDKTGSWPNIGTSGYLDGAISHVAVYPTALTALQVRTHYREAVNGFSVNTPPTASLTAAVDGSVLSVDGSASSDEDAPLSTWTWDFGDGATGTGATATHTYAEPGEYTVTLTVTDDEGATHSASEPVVVEAPPAAVVVAADSFDRTVDGGWGTADLGGAWTLSGTAARFSTSGGDGMLTLTTPVTQQATLDGVSAVDATVSASFSVDKIAHAQYVTVIGRRVGTDQYQLRTRIASDGSLQLNVLRGGTAVGGGVQVPGLTLVPGNDYRVVFEVTGTAPTTLRGKIWRAADPEPATWNVERTDATPAMQTAGSVGVSSYVPSSAGAFPLVLAFRDIEVTVPGAR